MANKLASLRNRRFVVPVSVDEVMMRINDAGCNVPPATYKKYESGILKLNKLDVINALCKYYGISTSFFSNDNVHLSFKIPELFEFDKNRINKWVPVYDDFYQSRKRFEVIDYPYLICNLVEYQGYHILLNGDAFDTRRRASDEYQETVGKPKGFTELEAWASGMGLAYVDANFNFIKPFSGNRMPDKTFVGIVIENWDEFKKDIWSRDSRYRKFLDLLTDNDEETIENNCTIVEF